MSPTQTPAKTVVEIYPDTHERLKKAAKGKGDTVKRFTSLLLEYALGKLSRGELKLSEPAVEEVSETPTGA